MAEWTALGTTLLKTAKECRPQREQAACWLLAESGAGSSYWPERLQDAGLLHWQMQDSEDWDLAFVRWDAHAEVLAHDTDPADGLYGTAAEWCMLRIACSLMTGKGGDWGAGLTSLDTFNQRIALATLAWSAGGEKAAYPYMLPMAETAPHDARARLHLVDESSGSAPNRSLGS